MKKHLKIALGLVLVAGLMAVGAAPAMAAGPKWVTCLKVASGKWTNSTCSKAGAGEWETSALSATIEVTSDGTLELEDSEATGGAVRITCKGTSTGTIGVEGTGSIKTITATGCTFVKNGECESSKEVTAEARNLGWSTKLEEKPGEVRDNVTSLVSGKEPGWAVKCHVLGVFEITDVCEANASTKVINPSATKHEGSFETEFETNSGNAKCSAGGAASGHVFGPVLSVARISNAPRTAWVLAPVTGFPA